MDTNLKILIIGAGPTGLTAALEFARHGIIPEIVERRTQPSEISRAVGIMPESIEKLRQSGVGDIILKEGMNLGIDDAIVAVKSILEEKTFEYTKKRHVIGARIMKQSEIARKTIKSNKFLVKAFTGIALKLVHHIGFLQRALIGRMTRL